MPTYEFRCPKGHEFDRFYKTMSTAPLEQPCPECGVVAMRQLSGGGGLVFKGSGFYLTDYGKNAHRGEAPEKKGGEGGTDKPDSAKSDSAKSDGGKSDGKPDGAKAEGGKAEGAKSEGGRGDASKAEAKKEGPKTEGAKTESSKPKAQSPKPQSE